MPDKKTFFHNLRLVFQRDSWWAETWSGIAMIIWAVWDLKSVWTSLLDVPSLRSLGVIDSGAWIGTGVALGLAQLLALSVDERRCRWIGSFIAAMWWGILFWYRLATNSLDPSLALYAVMVGINLYGMTRLPLARQRG